MLLLYLTGGGDDELDSDDLEDEDEDDDDPDEEEEEEAVGSFDSREQSGAEALDSLKNYMDHMDQELLGTNIGKSFVQSDKVSAKCPGGCSLKIFYTVGKISVQSYMNKYMTQVIATSTNAVAKALNKSTGANKM